MDASRCGVPQHRNRFFCIGALNAPDAFLAEDIFRHYIGEEITVAEYFANNNIQLDIDAYYRHPTTYHRRAIFGTNEVAPTIRGVANVSTDDCLWQLGSYILVECKNWKQHVTLPQIRNIAYISSMKGNKCALLFATNGITREAKKEVLRLAATGIYILVITKEDLLELSCEQDCYSMIISKFEDLENNQDNIPV